MAEDCAEVAVVNGRLLVELLEILTHGKLVVIGATGDKIECQEVEDEAAGASTIF
jgi:hypothetical protein